MKRYYPNLVEACIEFKIHSKTLIAKHSKKKYVPNQADQSCAHSSLFKLAKDPDTGFIYCLKLDQSIAERKQEKSLMQQKPNFDENGKPIMEPETPRSKIKS